MKTSGEKVEEEAVSLQIRLIHVCKNHSGAYLSNNILGVNSLLKPYSQSMHSVWPVSVEIISAHTCLMPLSRQLQRFNI